MAFSSRTHWDQTPNELARRIAELRRAGEPILDLTESNPSRAPRRFATSPILEAGGRPARSSPGRTPAARGSARAQAPRITSS
jgi:hypothetical protein